AYISSLDRFIPLSTALPELLDVESIPAVPWIVCLSCCFFSIVWGSEQVHITAHLGKSRYRTCTNHFSEAFLRDLGPTFSRISDRTLRIEVRGYDHCLAMVVAVSDDRGDDVLHPLRDPVGA